MIAAGLTTLYAKHAEQDKDLRHNAEKLAILLIPAIPIMLSLARKFFGTGYTTKEISSIDSEAKNLDSGIEQNLNEITTSPIAELSENADHSILDRESLFAEDSLEDLIANFNPKSEPLDISRGSQIKITDDHFH